MTYDTICETPANFNIKSTRNQYTTYETAFIKLDLEKLGLRRHNLMLKFAKDGIETGILKNIFPREKYSPQYGVEAPGQIQNHKSTHREIKEFKHPIYAETTKLE